MTVHAADCARGEYCLCDIPRYWRGIGLCLCAVAAGALGLVMSGGSISVYAILLHAFADGGVYALGIFIAHRAHSFPAAGRRWRRLSTWVNAVLMFGFAYVVAGEAIERLASGQPPLRGGWIVFAGLAGAFLNLVQHALVRQGETHSLNLDLNRHNLGDIAEGLVVAATGAVIAGAGAPVFDLAASGALAAWFLFLGVLMVLGRDGHHH